MDSPAANAVNDVINLNGNVDSGGLARWVVYAIIAVVAAIAITIAVVFTRKKIQESREDGGIIKDVGEAIMDDVDKQVADDMLEVAIRAQTESAQLSADMETAKQLFALGQVSQADVDKAVAAAEASKTAAIQKNAEAAKALEAFRKKELATANATVLEATKRATGLSQEYEKVSDGITEQKVKEANALLAELVKKRQQAESDYNDALDTKKKAEAAFLESKKTKAENKRGIIATMNKKISDLKEKIKRAKISNPVPKPPTPQPPAPKPPAPKPPAPKPPVPKPPTALERKYPYWGWNEHAGLRCTNNNNTGCNTGYDAKGQLVDLNPDRPPAPGPSQNNPQGIPDQVMRTLGMDVEQVTNTLNLINGPEQSQSRWWERTNKQNVYSYCENIRDKRGVTMGLTGFVTAYNGPQEIIRNAGGPSFANGRYGTDSYSDERALCNWVKDNANNKRFHDAQWDYYLKMYIKPMMDDMRKYVPAGIRNEPLIIAAALDATINQGGGICGNCSGDFMKNARGNDRANWLNDFLNLRDKKFTAGNSTAMRLGRLGAFRKLAVDGKWDMRGVDACKYNYCSGRCVHC